MRAEGGKREKGQLNKRELFQRVSETSAARAVAWYGCEVGHDMAARAVSWYGCEGGIMVRTLTEASGGGALADAEA